MGQHQKWCKTVFQSPKWREIPKDRERWVKTKKMVQNCEQEDEERYIHLGDKRMCIDLNKKYLCKGRVGYKLIIIR
jgi:hypothetical protein